MKNLFLLQRKEKFIALALALSILAIVISCYAYQNQNLIATLAIISLGLIYVLIKSFSNRLNYLTELTKTIDGGELPARYSESKEVGLIGHLKSMYYKMQEIVSFVQSLGGEQFEFKHIEPDGKIGLMLTDLYEKQHAYAEDERKRNWKNEGLAKFGELLRMDDKDLKEMSLKILSSLVRYIEANQGGFFIAEEQNGKRYMELMACYAYDRKKFIEARVEEGQGILGQVMLEKDIIYLTDVPSDFVRITSGLGEATPKNIVIVPLIVNDNFYGALELASFKILEPYQIDFLKELAENIASTVAAVKINENTRMLLEQSQQMSQELQTREEEMRQSMEELQATQEEMARNQEEINSHLSTIDKTIASLEFDMQGKISYVNQVFLDVSGYEREELIGNNYEFLLPTDEIDKPQTQMMWTSLQDGNSFTGQFKQRSKSGKCMWLSGTLNPILDDRKKPLKVMMFAQFNTKEKEKQEDLVQVVNALKNSAPLIEFSSEGLFKSANEKFFEIFGYSRMELRQKPLEFFFDNTLSPSQVNSFLQRLRENEFMDEVLSIVTKSGDKKTFRITFSPIFNMEGQLVKTIAILIDEISTVFLKTG